MSKESVLVKMLKYELEIRELKKLNTSLALALKSLVDDVRSGDKERINERLGIVDSWLVRLNTTGKADD